MKFWLLAGFVLVMVFASAVAAQETPEPVPLVDEGDFDIVNFLLLGSDTTNPRNAGRTDAILIVSVNKTAGTVAFLSLPRDLWLYIPTSGMQRINTAYGYGESSGYDGGGARLVADTIEHNFGMVIDHHARVDFNGFKQIVDDLGGVDISVDCGIEDWRLSDPSLDPMLESSWEMFTLPVGVHRMDGDLALWYMRSRRTSNDIDRGRRHQAMVRALWQRVRALGLIQQVGDIWPKVTETVRTDIGVDLLVELAPLAMTIDSSRIVSRVLRVYHEIWPVTTAQGGSVLELRPEAVAVTIGQLYQPPTHNQLARENAQIEIVNASGWRPLSQVAADRLAVEGFVPRISADTLPARDFTLLYDYTGQTKGSSLAALRGVLRLGTDAVISEPDPNRTVDFRVVIGQNYRACTYNVMAPRPADDG
jgi:polyisoprenyl-teichoic acid--peptidoglycan teichoic acid transferase